MIMKHPFPDKIVREAQIYAQSKYPEEACGFILEDKFLPVKNVADNKKEDFKITQKEFLKYNGLIKAIVHSHADYPHLSKADMESQIRTALPWGVIMLTQGAVEHTIFFGEDIIYPLIGRPFIHGVWDCFSLARDYYRSIKGYDIKEYPRENLWWNKDPSMLENGYLEAGFDYVNESQIREGDGIFMKIRADVINHSGVVLKNGLMLHHLYNKLSRREPLNRWRKYICGYLRYKHA